ncbi:hypothetical protein BUALT_Bualt07G0127600 [Buddleja alternifolia]|uniref:Glycosyl transferase family 1 domain-containing protein n=1 Tax=Buddleja alternifolia TaxID=168488 RepID=A0AAV6XAE8_9LAMI|nr:hypothetical protein BUALT_Bualt07G0127600 [Buddleja alternifolia]
MADKVEERREFFPPILPHMPTASLVPLQQGGNVISLSPMGSLSFRRLNSPRRDGKSVIFSSQLFTSNRIVLLLLLITLWVSAGFFSRSIWAHGDNTEDLFSGYGGDSSRRDLIANIDSESLNSRSDINKSNGSGVLLNKSEKSGERSPEKPKVVIEDVESEVDEEIPKQNTTYGLLVGLFGSLEDTILEKVSGTCGRKGTFGRLVWSRKFVLIFHELSITGAPLAMLELVTEFLSCGATISVIILNKKGGLMPKLSRTKIEVLEDESDLRFKTAMKADLIIVGSAVCWSWIEFSRSCGGSWRTEESTLTENIQLISEPALVPLSVNDELAFVAGTTGKMVEKRMLLRDAVRKEMGLTDDDMLVVTLSTIYPGKGHLLLLESTRLVIEQRSLIKNKDSILTDYDYYHSRTLLQKKDENLKILIGSVGSECNKVPYVKTLLRYLSTHSNVSKSVLWTPVTTRVASLYAAADVYVMNSQGLGETFGRVTIEAMAFGLPVLGTDSGGTREIVEHNVTGFLYPLGRPGVQVLARNLEYLLQNPSKRQEMGKKGREKVEKMYLKKHMFHKFGEEHLGELHTIAYVRGGYFLDRKWKEAALFRREKPLAFPLMA